MNPTIDKLLLNPKTLLEAQTYVRQPTHALMIVGLPGSGKTSLALELASSILGSENVASHPYFLHLQRPEGKQDIPIEDVRTMLHQLKLKAPGKQAVRRIVFIENAHHLSAEAQNALLKAIEEPADDTIFILSTTSAKAVLPTIASRTQVLSVHPVAVPQIGDFYSGKYSDNQIAGAWQLSQGQMGLLNALLTDAEHPLRQAVETAKDLLRKPAYERLLVLDKLSKDKEALAEALIALSRVLTALHHAAINRSAAQQKRLMAARKLIQKLQAAQADNASARLIALELALNLKV